MTKVTGRFLPSATICCRRPPGAISAARSSLRNTGVCWASGSVSAVRCVEEISGHMYVSCVFFSASDSCQGRNVRSMPSTCS